LLAGVLIKARFWQRHAGANLTERQRKVLNRLLDAGPGGFEGGMTTRKYASLAGVSKATAQRELADLVEQGLLQPNPGSGRSASYDVCWKDI
jgi:Fic family protein